MTTSKSTLIILVVLWCGSTVHSETPRILSKTYTLPGKVIVGKDNINKRTLAFALCNIEYESASCSLNLVNDALADYESPISCDSYIETQLASGKIDILGVQLWGTDKILFSWRDIDLDNVGQGYLHVQAMKMSGCRSTEYATEIDIHQDGESQEHIIPDRISYDVSFVKNSLCNDNTCKVTVDSNGRGTHPEPWFEGTAPIVALEAMENHSNRLLITLSEENYGRPELYLLGENGKVFLTYNNYRSYIGWSASNNILSFCHYNECNQYNYDGGLENEMTFFMQPSAPIKYVAVYNLPNKEIVALVCHRSSGSVHRIVKIGIDGNEQYNIPLNDLRCRPEPKVLSAKFFKKNSSQYCLALFYSELFSSNSHVFKTYCFSF